MSSQVIEHIRLRVANEDDIGFIFNSWLKSYRASSVNRDIINATFFTEHHKVLERILKHAQVIIACSNEDPMHIYGWICAEYIDGIFCLHYIYIKHSFRKMGVGRLLFNAFEHSDAAGIYTHHTQPMRYLGERLNLMYHPYIWINNYLAIKE